MLQFLDSPAVSSGSMALFNVRILNYMSDVDQIKMLYNDMKHWLSGSPLSLEYRKQMHSKYALGIPIQSGTSFEIFHYYKLLY